MAKTCYHPWDRTLVPDLQGRAEALADTFKAQEVANTLWAYATMRRVQDGRREGAVLEGKAGTAAKVRTCYGTLYR